MATINKTLTDSYAIVGAGPCVVTLEVGALAELHIAASSPAADAPPFRLRSIGPKWVSYGGADNIYAKKSSAGVAETILSYTEAS